jgi:hypothetical protein
VFLYAFDLIELNGDDLRREPLEVRKATLASALAKAAPGLRLNDHIEADGPTVFAHACKMGLEGIVSKRKISTYRSAVRPTGSRARTRRARRCGARPRKTGARIGEITSKDMQEQSYAENQRCSVLQSQHPLTSRKDDDHSRKREG